LELHPVLELKTLKFQVSNFFSACRCSTSKYACFILPA